MARSKYVYHVDTEIVHDVMDGYLFSVPPGEPYEFTNAFFAEKFIQHKWMHGVVEVELERTRTGWTFKLEDAHSRALAALRAADEAYANAYIETQQQDRLMQGRPAAPPSARQKRILHRQQVNLEEFGIRPVGTKSNQDKMLEAVMEQNKVMMAMFMAMVQGGDVKSALAGMVGRVTTTAPSNPSNPPGENDESGSDDQPPYPIAPPRPPRNITVPSNAVVERPDPVHPPVRMYSEGEDLAVQSLSDLGPDFEGDVNDPNQVRGPVMPGSERPLDLNQSGIGNLLNVDEDRVKLRVPSPKQGGSKPTGPVRPEKSKVDL